MLQSLQFLSFFFFNDTATTEIYTLSLHDALPIWFAGANEPEKVNRTVYQAFLAAVALWGLLLAPLGWLVAPALLGVVNAAPAVRAEALPFLRIMFVGSLGMLLFFMVGGALRAAGDARTPLRLGILLTVLNIACNVAFITGLGPFP